MPGPAFAQMEGGVPVAEYWMQKPVLANQCLSDECSNPWSYACGVGDANGHGLGGKANYTKWNHAQLLCEKVWVVCDVPWLDTIENKESVKNLIPKYYSITRVSNPRPHTCEGRGQ